MGILDDPTRREAARTVEAVFGVKNLLGVKSMYLQQIAGKELFQTTSNHQQREDEDRQQL